MKVKIISLFVAVFFLVQLSNATTYFVRANTGNDLCNDDTLQTPFKTLSRVFSGSPVLNDGDVIDISGTFAFSFNTRITKNITINGDSKSTSIIKGNLSNPDRCFNIVSGKTLTIQNVSFYTFDNYNSAATKEAGVIYVGAGATLVCNDVDFFSNRSTIGGAVSIISGIAEFTDCYFRENKVINWNANSGATSGALNVNCSTGNVDVKIDRCLFETNESQGSGAALYFKTTTTGQAKLLIQNSTFYGNKQTSTGNEGVIGLNITGTNTDIKLINNTIAYNTSMKTTTDSRPGLYISGDNDKVVLINNILCFNTDSQTPPASRSIVGVRLKETRNNLTDMNFDFVTNTKTSFASDNQSGVTSTDIGLATTLADNGGKTKTLILDPNSKGANAGYSTGAPTVDQRNVSRHDGIDIGAYESTRTLPARIAANNNLQTEITYLDKTTQKGISFNQSTGCVTFTNIQNYDKVTIYNTAGKQVQFQNIANRTFEFKSDSGLYYIRFNNNSEIECVKILLK